MYRMRKKRIQSFGRSLSPAPGGEQKVGNVAEDRIDAPSPINARALRIVDPVHREAEPGRPDPARAGVRKVMTPRREATRNQALPWPNANPVAPGWRLGRGESRAQGAVPHREPRVTRLTAKAAEAEGGRVQPSRPPRSPAPGFRPGWPRAQAPVSVRRWRRARARERTPTRPPGWEHARRRTADQTTRPRPTTRGLPSVSSIPGPGPRSCA